MKTKTLNTIGILALALSSGAAFAQNVPNSFSYQAVISAEDGSPVSNHQITVEVSIKQGNDCEDNTCPVLWQELHSPKTNDFGSFSIEIGDKNAINTTGGSLSKYSDIDWLNTTNGNYYMQVRVDFGEASYLNGMTDLGTTKFSAVPYALAAQTADYANSIATDAKGNIKNTLGQLADVTISDAKANQILVYDGTLKTWKNTDPAAAQGLTNINISDPKTGDHLIYNAENGKWENKASVALSLSDLSDVKNMTTVNGSDALVYNGTTKVWENKTLKLNSLQDVNTTGAAKDQVLTFNGTFWEAQTPATGGETVTKLSELTGDVKLSADLAAGQILRYSADGKWENANPAAENIWVGNSDNVSAYTTNKIGIVAKKGSETSLQPQALLHIKDGNNNTLFNARGITIGANVNRIKTTASIALGGGNENDVQGTAVLAGNGSTSGEYSVNSVIMGDGAKGDAKCDIVIGNNSSAANDHCAVFGSYLKAGTAHQYVFGKYNTLSTSQTFIVANGTGTGSNTLNIFTIDGNGNVSATGTFNGSSDKRLKTNINSMNGSLDNVLKLRGVTYNWKKDADNTKLQYGFIAQEVEEVLPDLVGTDSNGYKTVNYIGVIPVLTEAIKTQQEEIESLKSENEQLKSTLDQLLKRVEALENNR